MANLYNVHFKGSVEVEADNKEDAMEQAAHELMSYPYAYMMTECVEEDFGDEEE